MVNCKFWYEIIYILGKSFNGGCPLLGMQIYVRNIVPQSTSLYVSTVPMCTLAVPLKPCGHVSNLNSVLHDVSPSFSNDYIGEAICPTINIYRYVVDGTVLCLGWPHAPSLLLLLEYGMKTGCAIWNGNL